MSTILDVARLAGVSTATVSRVINSPDTVREETREKVLRESQIDGLVITTTNPKGEILKTLIDENFPFVLLFSTVKSGPFSAVGVDKTIVVAILRREHLVSLGHKRICMVAGKFSMSDRSFHRWHGYKKCLRDNGIPYDKQGVACSDRLLPLWWSGLNKKTPCPAIPSHRSLLFQRLYCPWSN